jgi:hypothetical protein
VTMATYPILPASSLNQWIRFYELEYDAVWPAVDNQARSPFTTEGSAVVHSDLIVRHPQVALSRIVENLTQQNLFAVFGTVGIRMSNLVEWHQVACPGAARISRLTERECVRLCDRFADCNRRKANAELTQLLLPMLTISDALTILHFEHWLARQDESIFEPADCNRPCFASAHGLDVPGVIWNPDTMRFKVYNLGVGDLSNMRGDFWMCLQRSS